MRYALWNPISRGIYHLAGMVHPTIKLEISPAMEEYIRSKSSDLRIATTCEGPLLFSVRVSPPKPTDHIVQVGDRKVYVSALQAQHIKAIDERMLPRCAIEARPRR
jgi:hypothetical protein